MRQGRTWMRRVLGIVVAGIAVTAAPASAQVFGIGGQGAWFKAADADSSSFMAGAHLRYRMTPFLGFEGAVDYRKDTYLDGELAVKFYPVMASLMLYIIPEGPFNPYLLGGVGFYFTTTDFGDGASETHHDFGYHVGVGLNWNVSAHLAIFGEFRYLQVDVQVERNHVSLGANGSAVRAGVTLYLD